MPSRHAVLAPSASKRWMACAPSARAEQGCPEQDTVFTREGTLAHSCAEALLNYYKRNGELKDFEELKDDFLGRLVDFRDTELDVFGELSNECTAENLDFWEMMETVHDYYVRPVFEDYLAAKVADPQAQLLVESELTLDSFIPEGFGSSDAVIIYDDRLCVYDLKYGKGVKVEAENNPQMMCYALGALFGDAEMYAISHVSMAILQPRLKHVSTWTISYEELVSWGRNILRPAAEKAYRGEGEYNPGDHCKFCRFAPRCRACALRAKVVSEAYGQPEALTDEELSEALSMLESIKSWATHLEEYALKTVLDGHAIPGWKAVEGRSVRKIQDQDAAIRELVAAGLEKDAILKPAELRTITDLEKMLGKAGKAILAPFIVKPAGKPTLAPLSDKRPALSDAKSDFKDIID